jgi:hypothetical protein
MRCRDEQDLLRRHYRHVAVFACVEQARKDERTGSRTEIAGFRFNAGLSAGRAGGTGIECTDADSPHRSLPPLLLCPATARGSEAPPRH